jgi:hypothetical protein
MGRKIQMAKLLLQLEFLLLLLLSEQHLVPLMGTMNQMGLLWLQSGLH